MRVQSILPFIIYHVENGEEVTIKECLKTLRDVKKKYSKKMLSKKNLRNAIKYYGKLAKEMEDINATR